MVWNYAFGFLGTMAMAMLLGLPAARWCGLGSGIRTIGYASALGTSLLLIACRAVQMLWPIEPARWVMLAVFAAVVVFAWTGRFMRAGLGELLRADGRSLGVLLVAIIVVGVLLGGPILFGHAIQYDGSRNADSFTFTQNAQYMLHHVFHGAADFSPERPVYAISRQYFGDGAMQPRPAAEGLLAWLSALRGVDPMYLYNAVQAAGVMLAGLAVLAFLPAGWRARGTKDSVLLAIYVIACPSLIHIAANSNYANAFSLPAATVYVALGLVPRTRGTFVVSVLSIGALLSGYPELLIFVGMARALGVVVEGVAGRSLVAVVREAMWMLGELVVACLLLPWAALATLSVYKTTLGVSQVGASELGGNMYAGVPLFAAAAIALAVAWKALGTMGDRGRRAFLLSILMAFVIAQAVMLARGFDYGGFKVSEYFVTLIIGVILRAVLMAPAGVLPNRATRSVAIALAVLMVLKSGDVLRRAWDWSHSRRVTADLVEAGRALGDLSHGLPVMMGSSPQPYYYGMWVAYLASSPIAYDLTSDPDAAGYLSPYLRLTGRMPAMLDAAQLRIDVDAKTEAGEVLVGRFGSVKVVSAAINTGRRH